MSETWTKDAVLDRYMAQRGLKHTRQRTLILERFFAMGGHSLLAIRVLGKLSRKFGVRLPLRSLFDAPTIEELAELVDLETQIAAVSALSDDPSSGR